MGSSLVESFPAILLIITYKDLAFEVKFGVHIGTHCMSAVP